MQRKANHRGWVAGPLAILAAVGMAGAAPASAGSWQNNLALGGFNKVHLYTPDSTSPVGSGHALLIVLHGCTQSIDAFKTAKLEAAAEEFGMVVAVPDAMNKAGFGCWSYFQGPQSRGAGDYLNLINLANTLSGDASRSIDPNQVYIAGLSSGASFANTAACLAPDVFAGVGVSAGPSILTSSNGALGPCETADVETRCRDLAGGFSTHFDTQIASIAQGDADTTVNLCYNTQNAEGMAGLYGVNQLPGTNVISEGAAHTAGETLWQNGRVSMLWLNGLAHAWSGGSGASGSFIGSQSINYARYLGQFFSAHNLRVDRNVPPSVTQVSAAASGQVIQVSGVAQDSDGIIASVDVLITGVGGAGADTFSTNVDGTGFFQASSAALADDLYTVAVSAIDNDGGESEPVVQAVRIGAEPPPQPPVLSGISVAKDGQCATVSGQVVDENLDLVGVSVAFATGTVSALVSGTNYSANVCNLPGGSNTATVVAVDAAGLSAEEQVSFLIDAGQVATLQQHVDAGRLDYTNYANCYLEYGSTAVFTLTEQAVSGGQCRWQDDDGSCSGPLVACSAAGGGGTTPPPDPPPSTCAVFSDLNYNHKVAGRAFSTGNFFVPDYFATGSNEPMAGSTYGVTSLSSNDGGSVWHVGVCP